MRQHRGFAAFTDKVSEDKVVYLSTGGVLHFRKDPRFGRWSIKPDAGQVPESLRGSYTTYQEAYRACAGCYDARGVTLHKDKQDRYSSSVNEVREEMGLERK
jgi:sulfur relay (sulfurtransferase) complex TusBCD TusD component (DsrE family)